MNPRFNLTKPHRQWGHNADGKDTGNEEAAAYRLAVPTPAPTYLKSVSESCLSY